MNMDAHTNLLPFIGFKTAAKTTAKVALHVCLTRSLLDVIQLFRSCLVKNMSEEVVWWSGKWGGPMTNQCVQWFGDKLVKEAVWWQSGGWSWWQNWVCEAVWRHVDDVAVVFHWMLNSNKLRCFQVSTRCIWLFIIVDIFSLWIQMCIAYDNQHSCMQGDMFMPAHKMTVLSNLTRFHIW